MEDPNMKKCANDALSENIDCGADPESCKFVMDKNCEKIMLETACTIEGLKNLSTISMSENGDASTVDPKLTINEMDCV